MSVEQLTELWYWNMIIYLDKGRITDYEMYTLSAKKFKNKTLPMRWSWSAHNPCQNVLGAKKS